MLKARATVEELIVVRPSRAAASSSRRYMLSRWTVGLGMSVDGGTQS